MIFPLVSILIPVFNREHILFQTLDSALSQTYSNIEIIVVDNCSTDGTWGVIQGYVRKDSRIKAYRNDTNIGPVRNWLACVGHASGIYAKILWSDDLIHPEFLEKLLPFFSDPSVGFAYSSAKIFSDDLIETGFRVFTKIDTGIHNSQQYIIGTLLEGDFPMSPGCAIFRTSDLKKNLLLNVPNNVGSVFSMHAIGNDLLLFLLTARGYQNFAVINEPLSYFRAHEGSITMSSSSGKIPLHYDLAKGYFAEKYIYNVPLLKKINAIFFIHLIHFKSERFGIKYLVDFYPSKKTVGFDLIYLIQIMMKKVFRKIYAICRTKKYG